ncbi:MAG: SIMPL domain-containing protein [Corynebacteriales bacterium]|nr:SIMPL domain-containing protein [Mycobacteriales bacterium]
MSKTGITVTGEGRVSQKPDILLAKLGAEVTASSVESALERCSAHMSEMIKVLHAGSVPGSDTTTAGASVRNAYSEGKARGWVANQSLSVRFRDLAQAGELVTRVLSAGGNAARLHHLGFDVDDPTEAQHEARRLAFADAQTKAELYAQLASRQLGAVNRVLETGSPGGGAVMRTMSAGRAGSAPAMPVESGSLDITVTVEINWDLI